MDLMLSMKLAVSGLKAQSGRMRVISENYGERGIHGARTNA